MLYFLNMLTRVSMSLYNLTAASQRFEKVIGSRYIHVYTHQFGVYITKIYSLMSHLYYCEVYLPRKKWKSTRNRT